MESKPTSYASRTVWIFPDGTIHREDGPAVIWNDGSEEWLVNDKFHREDGPARIWADGQTEWWMADLMHRMDGPAFIYPSGQTEWWINGYKVTAKIHAWAKEMDIDLNNLSEDDKIVIAMKWG